MIKRVQLVNLDTKNKNKVIITTDKGRFNLFFSYLTLVAIDYCYDVPEWKTDKEKTCHKKRCIKNYWSTTTGKLLNEIEPDKKKRISREKFDSEMKLMFNFINS